MVRMVPLYGPMCGVIRLILVFVTFFISFGFPQSGTTPRVKQQTRDANLFALATHRSTRNNLIFTLIL